MHDIRFIRENPEDFDAALARRGHPPVAEAIKKADAERRNIKHQLDTLRAEKKRLSASFGQLAAQGQGNTSEALEFKRQSVEVAQQISELEAKEREPSEADEILKTIPNLPAPEVPDGSGEEDNVIVPITSEGANPDGTWGKKRVFDFTPKEHADLAPALGMDFETGARLSGARFTFLRGDMARLHRALGQFMLDVQTREHGYAECNPPVLVGDDAMYGTDKLPKFAEDSFTAINEYLKASIEHEAKKALVDQIENAFGLIFAINEDFFELSQTVSYDPVSSQLIKELTKSFDRIYGEVGKNYQEIQTSLKELSDKLNNLRERKQDSSLWLIPTSEVSLTASVMGELLDESALPMRLTALTLCFRSEAGAAGRDTRGFIRQHQFEKCELVSIVRPEDSEEEHQRMTRAAETILERLGLPYRKLLLCTGDMGFGAKKTYDLEVWLPGQGAFREISSCSNTGDFQARRMKTRYRRAEDGKPDYVHTLNGSGLAVGRTLVAVIENYQNADGSVTVPEALLPYMGGVTILRPQ